MPNRNDGIFIVPIKHDDTIINSPKAEGGGKEFSAEAPQNMESDYAGIRMDFMEAAAMSGIGFTLAFNEIQRRYKRTLLGPFWTTASLGFFIFTLGFLYAHLWQIEPSEYLPYLTTGMICWMLLSSNVTEGAGSFIAAEGILKQTRMPFTLFLMTTLIRNLIVFAHHLLIYLFVALYFSIPVGWNTLLLVPGLLLFSVLCAFVALNLALICARYRDIQQIIVSILQVMLFITPVLYKPDLLQGRALMIAEFNPIYHAINLVRAPLLGVAPDLVSWAVCIVLSVILGLSGFILFARVHRYLIYWI